MGNDDSNGVDSLWRVERDEEVGKEKKNGG